MILVDSREHYADFACKKFREVGIESDITTLPYSTGADYLIANDFGSCAVQRKDSMAEICGDPVSITKKFKSAMEELLLDILPRLQSFTDNPVLLVEESHTIGEMGYLFRRQDKHWVETEMHCSSYYGFLETVRMKGVDVVCTRNFDASLWYIISMHGYLGKMHYPPHQKFFKPEQMAVGMLACIPGVGEKKAMKALDGRSILEIANAKEVKGLNEKQLSAIRNVVRLK